MVLIKLLYAVSVPMLLLLAACSKENTSPGQEAAKLPPDFNLVFGEGGGFTGIWQGHTIDSSGAIYSWQGRMAGENMKPAGKLSGKQMKALWREIQQADLFAQQLDERGNMTAVMRVTANGATREWAWIPQMGMKAAAITAPQQLQQYCQQLVEQAAKD